MPRFMSAIDTLPSNETTGKTRRLTSMVAFSVALAAAPAFAKDPQGIDIKTTGKGSAVSIHVQAEAVTIPECLTSLKLTPQQQEEIKQVISNYNGTISTTWKKFSERYMQTIEMETSLLAAIEDNMTEPQRQQVRNQRRKTARHEKAVAAIGNKPNQAEVVANESTTKPATSAAEGLATAGVSLTDEQEAAADKLQEKYHAQLRSLNRDIQGLHTQLVSLEADKLVEIEKVLTKEQLVQLRAHRQNAPLAPKVATRVEAPAKTE